MMKAQTWDDRGSGCDGRVGVTKSVKYEQFRGGRQLTVAWRRRLAGPGAMGSTNETLDKLGRGPAGGLEASMIPRR